MKLYQIANDYTQALEYMMDPEKFQEGIDTLDSIKENLNDKLDNIAKLRQEKLAEAAALKEESKRLNERAAKAEKEAGNLENYVQHVMRQNKMEKVKTPLFDFGFTVSNSLVVTNQNEIPEHFLKPQPPKVDVAGMKKHLKEKYEEMGYKLVNKLSGKPGEMLVTDLDLEDLGVQFEIKESLKIK